MSMSTFFINANDTTASDSGVYACQAMLTIDGTEMFDYFDTSQVTLTGNVLDFIYSISV